VFCSLIFIGLVGLEQCGQRSIIPKSTRAKILDSDRLSGGVWLFKVLTEKRKASPHIHPYCLIAVWGVPVPVVEMDLEITHKIIPVSVNREFVGSRQRTQQYFYLITYMAKCHHNVPEGPSRSVLACHWSTSLTSNYRTGQSGYYQRAPGFCKNLRHDDPQPGREYLSIMRVIV
jgi:hypothetical protein